MNYRIENEAFSNFSRSILDNETSWSTDISAVYTELKKVGSSKNFFGTAASSTNEYITTIHNQLQKNLIDLVKLHSGNFSLFYSAWRNFETDNFGRIESSELGDIKKDLGTYSSKADGVEYRIKLYLDSISDLFTASRSKYADVVAANATVNTLLDNINTSINAIDEGHLKADFVNTELMIDSLKKLIKECMGKDRTFKANFTKDSVYDLNAWAGVSISSARVEYETSVKQDAFDEAKESAREIETQIKEYKKRETQVKIIKAVVTGVCVVASAAVIVCTAGAGTGVVIAAGAAVGAVTGAVDKSVELIGDEYVEKGNLNDMDWGDFAKDVAIAGVAGGVTGAISGAIGVGTEGVSSGLAKIAIGAGEEVINGIASRGVESGLEGVGNVITGKTDFRSALDDTFYDAVDPKEMGKDALKGTIKGVVKEGTKSVAKKIPTKMQDGSNSTLYDKYLNTKNADTTKDDLFTGSVVKGSVDKTASGVIKRYANSQIDGYTVGESLKDALDPAEMVTDAFDGAVSSGANRIKTELEDEMTIHTHAHVTDTTVNSNAAAVAGNPNVDATGATVAQNSNSVVQITNRDVVGGVTGIAINTDVANGGSTDAVSNYINSNQGNSGTVAVGTN